MPAKIVLALLSLSSLMATNGAAAAEQMNYVAQAAEGGIGILIITALSILFLGVTIERLVHFRARAVVPDGLIERVKPLWAENKFALLQAELDEEDSTLARVIAYMVKHRAQGYAVVSSGAGDIASIELRQHQQKAYALAIVATVAPIVGLLGTVLGMIDAFHVIAFADGMGNPALLAAGISKALINTAGGLFVALPSLAMHHYFRNRMTFFGLALEKHINNLLNEWFMPAPSPNLQVVAHAH
ncbi:MAG: MotA/TolQ/ExbB proton channel family protein [Massilia sp.]